MKVVDQILFKMPQDRELQFPAMSVLQAFVNGYNLKMKINDTSPNHDAEFELWYNTDLFEDDWRFFKAIGLKLDHEPQLLTQVDMMVDFSWERVKNYLTGRHLCEIYGALVGVESRPIPDILRIKPCAPKPFHWMVLADAWEFVQDMEQDASLRIFGIYAMQQHLLSLKDGECTGLIGHASWQTYLAASMGLPVIEIIPADRPITLLSKFTNRAYRVVVDCEFTKLRTMVQRAIYNLEFLCTKVANAEAQQSLKAAVEPSQEQSLA